MSTSAMYVAQTGLTSQQYRLQVIANNLSNVNTTGFKRERANFETQLYQNVRQSGGADDGGAMAVWAVGRHSPDVYQAAHMAKHLAFHRAKPLVFCHWRPALGPSVCVGIHNAIMGADLRSAVFGRADDSSQGASCAGRLWWDDRCN